MASWEQIALRAETALEEYKKDLSHWQDKYHELEVKYSDLQQKYDDLDSRSVTWSVIDFMSQEIDGWQISEDQAADALYDMIQNHDASIGISWDTVDEYIYQHGEEVEEGEEAWREYNKNIA